MGKCYKIKLVVLSGITKEHKGTFKGAYYYLFIRKILGRKGVRKREKKWRRERQN
jgi:hypothetical protein